MDSTVVSAGAALGGVLLGQVLARSGEYRKWLRTERHKAASEMLAAAETAKRGIYVRSGSKVEEYENVRGEAMAEASRVFSALESVRLVFPPRIVEFAERYSGIIAQFLAVQHTNPSALVEPPDEYYDVRAAFTRASGKLIAPGRSGASRRPDVTASEGQLPPSTGHSG
jgi:hypothetical protein